MSAERDPDAWKSVYDAKSPDEVAAAYAGWSSNYDAEVMALGYVLPFIVAGWLARHLPKGSGPILDAGCGTGLSGPFLRALGYDHVEGLDLSEEMLALATARGVYADLKQAELGKELPWPDGYFAAFFSTGVFTEGHATAAGFDELVRITRGGGLAVVTIREALMERLGFRAKFGELERAGRWRPVEESGLFRAFVISEPDALIRTFVFEVL